MSAIVDDTAFAALADCFNAKDAFVPRLEALVPAFGQPPTL
jgi:hypothetical protein